MNRKILVDVNVPREVCERLDDIGFNISYLTEVFPKDAEDWDIHGWLSENDALILTRDRDFPEMDGNHRVVLFSQSSVKLAREALHKLTIQKVFPRPLEGSWENSEG